MPSQLHEVLLQLFRNRPSLAPELLRDALGVVLPEHSEARIELGGSNRFTPFVIGPSGVPWVTSEEQARDDPELAVLSAMAHGKDPDIERSVKVADAAYRASMGLDEDRSRIYCDLIEFALSEAARRELQKMDPAKYVYQSEFARRYVAQGRAEGRTEGRADLLARQLAHRFGPLPGGAHERLATASIEELDAIGERLLTAPSLPEALG